MLSFLWSLFAIRILGCLGSRRIYRYFDGRRWRCIDPMLAARNLHSHPEYRPDVHPKLADAGDADALEVMLGAVRDVFGIPPFDGRTCRGLTEAETLGLLVDFTDWLATVKKNTSPSPTSPPPMGPEPSEASATKPAPDSGSIWTEPRDGTPA